jgi:hypothetical protein
MIGWLLTAALFFTLAAVRLLAGDRPSRASVYMAVAYGCVGVTALAIAFDGPSALGGLTLIASGVIGAAVFVDSVHRARQLRKGR